MAEIRNARLITKRTSVPGKIPTGTTGDESSFIRAGELASNLSDHSLWGYDGANVFEYGSSSFLGLTGGTINGNLFVTGNSVFNAISASTISNVDYIDFNTATTVSSKSGRVFYDSINNSLAYTPNTKNLDVNLQIGQEQWIKIYNNTGVQINNGQAVIITGATSGTPTVTLALAEGGDNLNFQADGIATHNIENGEYGFITNFGIVRDIDLSAFSEGELVYLSQNIPGAFTNLESLFFTGRTCEIGHVIDNSTGGTIHVIINNESKVITNTFTELNIINANNTSTGVFSFSGLSLSSSTTFNVSPIRGWIVDSTTNPIDPDIKYIFFNGISGQTTPYLNTHTETYVLITSAQTLQLQTTFPTPQERRQNIYLGKLGHADKVNIVNTFNEPDYVSAPLSQTRDMFTPIRLINGGVVPSPNGANLNFNISSGTIYGFGIGVVTNSLNPNTVSVTGSTPTQFQYRTQTGGTASNTITVDPANYDLSGVITSVGGGANSSTNQRIYLLQNGQIRIQYGQTVYGSLSEAISGVQSESFIPFSNFTSVGILIGILSVKKNATDLSDISQARFLLSSKFGETVGVAGGISTTTLQQAYNNSSNPEIVTNSTLDGVQFRSGTGNDLSANIIIENNAGNITGQWLADGSIITAAISAVTVSATTISSVQLSGGTIYSGNTDLSVYFNQDRAGLLTKANLSGATFTGQINVPTISATTYVNLPTDIRVTGGTYSNGNAVFTNNTGGTFTVSGFTSGDTYVTGVTISGGVLTVRQNQGQTNLTASTVESRSIAFNSNDMALNTATRITLTPLVMSTTRFGGVGIVNDAGVSFIVPQDYLNTPQFYYTWRSSTASANIAKIFMDIYTGTTDNLGSLTTSVETLSLTGSPTTANVFLFSPTVSSSLILSGGDNVHVRIYRDPGDAGDTFTGNLDMINFTFKYNSKS